MKKMEWPYSDYMNFKSQWSNLPAFTSNIDFYTDSSAEMYDYSDFYSQYLHIRKWGMHLLNLALTKLICVTVSLYTCKSYAIW